MVLVVLSGGPVDIQQAAHLADGVLWAGYPGQAGAEV